MKKASCEVSASHLARIVEEAPSDDLLDITILLRSTHELDLKRLEQLGAQLPGRRRVSTRNEFEELFGASPDYVETVSQYAASRGFMVVKTSLSERTVKIIGSASTLAREFRIELKIYDGLGGRYLGHEGSVTIPQEIAQVVDGVFGFDNPCRARPNLLRRHSVMATIRADLVAGSFTSLEIAELYNFPKQFDGHAQCIGIIDFGEGPSQEDLEVYFSRLGRPVPAILTVQPTGNVRTSFQPGEITSFGKSETTMAIEIAGAIVPQAHFVVYVAPPTEQGWVDQLRRAIHDQVNHPSVILVNWGWPEGLWTDAAVRAVDQAFREAAELGITIICSSGNDGAASDMDDGFAHVSFPAASSFALTCGGSSLRALNAKVTSETVWNNGPRALGGGASGGGVSERIAIPSWQSSAGVPVSLNLGKRGRGVPDVAANADPNTGYTLRLEGADVIVGGTSAAASLWSALVVIVNQAIGRPTGFINPLIYSRLAGSDMFHDIVVGNNDVTGSIGGYAATHGWNAATGWGSVDGTLFLNGLRVSAEGKPWSLPVSAIGQRWQMIPGLAFDLAAASDGSVWVVSTVPRGPFGSGIYHWNGATWDSIPGAGRRIAVTPERVYATIATAEVFSYEGGVWRLLPGFAHDIAAGKDGSLWAIGTHPIPGGFPVYQWRDDHWQELPSNGAIRIAVAPDGCPWLVTYQMEVIAWTGSAWRTIPPLPRRSPLVPGEAVDIGVGANGSVWVVTNPSEAEEGIFHWNGAGWDTIEGGGIGLSVRPDGMPWVINPQGQIYVRL